MRVFRAFIVLLALGMAHAASADTCSDIVDANVAEMRAGSSEWSSDAEQLIRAASGSACVKLLSSRYGELGSDSRCEQVIEDTVAEIRAGASGWWSGGPEQIVKTSAASACIKAMSGRYASASANTGSSVATSIASSSATSSADTATTSAPEKEGEDKDDGSWSFGGLTFKAMSGSPSKKPYERSRGSAKENEQ
ncbi:MAG: hypothetical protein AAF098_01880 [Pseudomonadota bacterium]